LSALLGKAGHSSLEGSGSFNKVSPRQMRQTKAEVVYVTVYVRTLELHGFMFK
jgi:hypothetical protein